MARFMAMTIINLVTPKAAAKRELLFNKPASGVYLSGAPSGAYSAGRLQPDANDISIL